MGFRVRADDEYHPLDNINIDRVKFSSPSPIDRTLVMMLSANCLEEKMGALNDRASLGLIRMG